MENIEILGLPEIPLYTYDKQTKQAFFLGYILGLFDHHCHHSAEFNRMMSSVNYQKQNIHAIEDLPYIPVRLFKMFELVSISREQVIKTMTSSGTTGQAVSKIFFGQTNIFIANTYSEQNCFQLFRKHQGSNDHYRL